jgi:hypothetical protein
MSESQKTLSFVGAALVVVVVAFATKPASFYNRPGDEIGKPFFPNFTDPSKASSIEIVEYDDVTGEPKPFKVAQSGGLWSIPSHSNYPADAAQQLGEAAASLVDVKMQERISDRAEDQALYGVVDPNSKDLSRGSTGIGKRVTLADDKGNTLFQLIIGKADDKHPDVHYVRVPSQDIVYRTTINTSKLSTKFDDWIEKDLLKLNAFDVKNVVMDDYYVDGRGIKRRSKIYVEYDSKDAKWNLADMKVFENPKLDKIADDEELNTTKLNDLKSALDDLKIIDVARKPAGLAGDLKLDEKLLNNEPLLLELITHGFYPAQLGDKFEIVSNDGEVRCGMNDGVEYLLRFGAVAGTSKSGEEKKDDKKEGEEKEKKDELASIGASRYVLVSARFNEDLIEKPTLEAVPGPAAPAAPPAENKPAEPKADAPKTDAKEGAKGDQGPEGKPGPEGKADAKPAEAKPAEAKPVEKPAGEAKPAETKPAEAKPAETKPTVEGPKPVDEKERERIQKENERKQKEYQEKVTKGQEKVKELNDRFADWYYIVANDTYQKIHLSRGDVVKKKDKPADDKSTGDKPADATPPAKDPFNIDAIKKQGLPQ